MARPRVYADTNCLVALHAESHELKESLDVLALRMLALDLEAGRVSLCDSVELRKETAACLGRKRRLQREVLDAADIYIERNGSVDDFRTKLVQSGLAMADATHLALAVAAEVDWFLTLDGALCEWARQNAKQVGGLRVAKPTEWAKERLQ